MAEDIPAEVAIEEAEALIRAAYHSTDDERRSVLFQWADEILKPLVAAKIPAALWTATALSDVWGKGLDEAAFDAEYWRRVREAADAGNAAAQFALACELDERATCEESARLFQAAAEQNHAYAQWCHGLNLFSGRGLPQDKEMGVKFIRMAADAKFEGAIKFLADAYANGSHGFPKDEKASADWWKTLTDKDVIHY